MARCLRDAVLKGLLRVWGLCKDGVRGLKVEGGQEGCKHVLC